MQTPSVSQTAQDYIDAQRQLEIEARQILPYAFDTCTKPLGPIRQLVFACMSCTLEGSQPAGICYSCSIACHGSHGELVELFSKRNFECDCGTSRMPGSCCNLRHIEDDQPQAVNRYNHNFRNMFCENEQYEAEHESGTMYQCLLGDCCGEDWFHDRCIIGDIPSRHLLRHSSDSDGHNQEAADIDPDESKILEEFPNEDSFEYFICWKCVSGNPWLLDYIGNPGFLDPVIRKACNANQQSDETTNALSARKRKANEVSSDSEADSSRSEKQATIIHPISTEIGFVTTESVSLGCKLSKQAHLDLVKTQFSLFLRANFRDHMCRCGSCLERLSKYKFMLEEETTYEPPLDSDAAESTGHESLLDAGEKALSSIDRVRAIEGVIAYNVLKEKVKEFLQPFAEEKRVVRPEDVKRYFEELQAAPNTNQSTAPQGEP